MQTIHTHIFPDSLTHSTLSLRHVPGSNTLWKINLKKKNVAGFENYKNKFHQWCRYIYIPWWMYFISSKIIKSPQGVWNLFNCRYYFLKAISEHNLSTWNFQHRLIELIIMQWRMLFEMQLFREKNPIFISCAIFHHVKVLDVSTSEESHWSSWQILKSL